MLRRRSSTEDPFLPARFELLSNAICGLALIEIVARYGYHLELLTWHRLLGDVLEAGAVTALLLRVPTRLLLRREILRSPLGAVLDLALGFLAAIHLARSDLLAAAGFAVLRQAFVAIRMLPRSRRFQLALLRLQTRPRRVLAISFLATILFGTFLLTLPAATSDGRGLPILDALFTATSAVCVTGLVVVDTGSFFTRFGQVVILGLIQIGALGIMTLSASVALLFRKRLGIRTRAVMQNLLDEVSVESLFRIVRYIFGMTLVFEALGAGILFLRWGSLLPDPLERAYHSLFLSVSAFCNAGFSLYPDSLAGPAGQDPGVLLTVSALILFGGIGFTVISSCLNRNLFRNGLRWTLRRLNTHSRLVLVISFLLVALGTLFLFFFEFGNSLEPLSAGEKFLGAFFQSITARTAGFHSVPPSGMLPTTLLLLLILMFIGAASGSTGGGIKVSTLGVLVLSVKAMLQGREDVEIYHRTIPKSTVYRAMAITVISGSLVVVFLILLLATQRAPFLHILFETVSAFANVGLSLGVTPALDAAGKLMVILLMYVGRIGPLTLALAVGKQLHPADYRYPETRILVG